MGASLQKPGGGGRGRGRRKAYTPMAEINVTPFVDVMLVLLIVFMVAAPLLTVSVPVDLPQARGSAPNADQRPVVVSIDARGTIFVGDSAVELDNLVPLLQAITQRNAEARIFVRGDRNLAYGRMVQVMGTLSVAGFSRVGLVATPDEQARR
jgi:biopolymer transport protein TolR